MPINTILFTQGFCTFKSSFYSLLLNYSMAPKKASHAPSSSQEASTKKTKKLSHSPTSYSSQDIKKRASLFSKRTIAPSRFMHEDTLKAIGCFDGVQNLLLVSGLFQFAFNGLPSCNDLNFY